MQSKLHLSENTQDGISVIVPIHNEGGNITALDTEIKQVITTINRPTA
jgi:hypothetical protein